jgi:hypothetical protein
VRRHRDQPPPVIRLVLTITADKDRISISGNGRPIRPVFVYPPVGTWKVAEIADDGKIGEEQTVRIDAANPRVPLEIGQGQILRLNRS